MRVEGNIEGVEKGEKNQPRILQAAKLFIKSEGGIDFIRQTKLKEFIVSRPNFQEMFKEVL